jgi:WD40 repeat protein
MAKVKVFISYSRKDKAFAERFTGALEKGHLETWIDWEDIPPTADWMDQVHKGIEQADAFLCLLSPDSAASSVCWQEVDHAVENGKRLLPIVVRDVHSGDVHRALAKANWIFCRTGDEFQTAVHNTLTAVRTDLPWVESHCRLQVRALEWQTRKDRSRLLRGKDLREAEELLARAGQKDPQPTDLQRRYVLESRRSESRTRNLLLMISAVVMVVLVIASLIAVDERNNAKSQEETAIAESNRRGTAEANALTSEADAIEQAETAVAAEATAEIERRIALSNGLASNALLLQEQGEISLAFLLSVEANQIAETVRSRQALFTLLKQNEYLLSVLPMPDMVYETFPSFGTNQSGDLLMAKIYDPGKASPWEYVLWDLDNYQMLDDQTFPVDSPVSIDRESGRLIPSESGQPFDGTMVAWESWERSVYLGPRENEVRDIFWLPGSRIAVTYSCKAANLMSDACAYLAILIFGKEAPFFEPQKIPAPDSESEFLSFAYDQYNQLQALTYDGLNNVMFLWQEQDGNWIQVETFADPGFVSLEGARGFELLPDRGLVAWGTSENKIVLWDSSSEASQELSFDVSVADFAISPDGTILAVRSEGRTKIFTHAAAGLPVETGIDLRISGAMAFGGDGQIFAVGARNQIWVFETSTWSEPKKIKIASTSDNEIANLFVSRDGKTIAVGMTPTKGMIINSYLVDIATGLETGPFEDFWAPIVSPDGKELAGMDYLRESMRLWSLDTDLWKAHACQIANRTLTAAEWRQYLGKESYQPACSGPYD